MLCVDLHNAFGPGRSVDNFTVLLLRLIAKADGANRAKLAWGFPMEVRAVEIYQDDCPYKDEACTAVDWDAIVTMAEVELYRKGA